MRSIARCLALLAALFLVGSPAFAGTARHGLNFGKYDSDNSNWSALDQRLPLGRTGYPTTSVIFCGKLANNGTEFLAPVGAGPGCQTGNGVCNGSSMGEGIDASLAGTACNSTGSHNSTEGSAAAIVFNGFTALPVGMYCRAAVPATGLTGSGANGLTFSLRAASAALSPSPSCTIPTGAVDCTWTPPAPTVLGGTINGNLVTIGSGATMDVRDVDTENLSANTGWCRVFFALPL